MLHTYADNNFIKTPYMGSDGDDFRKEFVEYLENIIKNRSWSAMSEHTFFVQGGKRAIEEVIAEINSV